MARVGGVKLGLNVKGTPVIVRGVRDPKLAFALALIRDGLLLLREFAQPALEVISADDVENICKQEFPGVQQLIMDMKFTVAKWKGLVEDVRVDITTWDRYVPDVWDCDNFAFFFKSWMAFAYHYTGIAVALGQVTINGSKFLHGFNYVLVDKNGKIVPYLYEPQLKLLVKAGKVTTFKLGGHTLSYEPFLMLWY